MLLDSNLIIYAAKPEHVDLRQFIAANAPAVSAVSVVEVLGYHNLTETEKTHFELFFQAAEICPVTAAVISQAVTLRQQRKMTLGDSLIAATALTNSWTLLTKNTKDFGWVPGLKLLDPIPSASSS